MQNTATTVTNGTFSQNPSVDYFAIFFFYAFVSVRWKNWRVSDGVCRLGPRADNSNATTNVCEFVRDFTTEFIWNQVFDVEIAFCRFALRFAIDAVKKNQ